MRKCTKHEGKLQHSHNMMIARLKQQHKVQTRRVVIAGIVVITIWIILSGVCYAIA